ncbi:hypothetical protein N1851_030819 [Merluccius polli]|uniref:DDE-1 domain-containing protein n=1 Tax=Merluccius polli TaxID=89951 RepID=A0AA47M544_MERPO|nr:hypothetical protein N1851_030819 [Merluccius polli]
MVGFNRPKVDMFFEIYVDELQKLGENFDPTRLWNMDEVGVQNVQTPNKIVGTKGKRQVARVTSAERGFTVTAACCMNAAGQFVPPQFIFPRKRMNERLLYGAPAGSIGGVTDSVWMDGTLFIQWLRHFCDTIGCTPQRPHILILDGHHSHKTLGAVLLARERGVVMITIPPHCTHKMQPLDHTFFKSYKSKYNTAADGWMTSHPGQRIDIYALCGLFDKAYSASASVGKGQKGFKVCGLWPVDKTVYKDEDFEGAEVTGEPDPALDDSRETEEEISAGPSGSSMVPTPNSITHSQPQPGTSHQRPAEHGPSGSTNTSGLSQPQPGTSAQKSADHGPSLSPSSLLEELSPRPRIQNKRPRKRASESAAVLTSSPYKKRLEDKMAAQNKGTEKKM